MKEMMKMDEQNSNHESIVKLFQSHLYNIFKKTNKQKNKMKYKKMNKKKLHVKLKI